MLICFVHCLRSRDGKIVQNDNCPVKGGICSFAIRSKYETSRAVSF